VITDYDKIEFFDDLFMSGALDSILAKELMCQYVVWSPDEEGVDTDREQKIREALLVVIEYNTSPSEYKKFKEKYVESTTD